MLSFILIIAFTVVWYALLVFIAWAAGGIVAAIIVALLAHIDELGQALNQHYRPAQPRFSDDSDQ